MTSEHDTLLQREEKDIASPPNTARSNASYISDRLDTARKHLQQFVDKKLEPVKMKGHNLVEKAAMKFSRMEGEHPIMKVAERGAKEMMKCILLVVAFASMYGYYRSPDYFWYETVRWPLWGSGDGTPVSDRAQVCVLLPTYERSSRFNDYLYRQFQLQDYENKRLFVYHNYNHESAGASKNGVEDMTGVFQSTPTEVNEVARFWKSVSKYDPRVKFDHTFEEYTSENLQPFYASLYSNVDKLTLGEKRQRMVDWALNWRETPNSKQRSVKPIKSCEVLAWWDDDDIYSYTYLSTMVEYLKANPNAWLTRLGEFPHLKVDPTKFNKYSSRMGTAPGSKVEDEKAVAPKSSGLSEFDPRHDYHESQRGSSWNYDLFDTSDMGFLTSCGFGWSQVFRSKAFNLEVPHLGGGSSSGSKKLKYPNISVDSEKHVCASLKQHADVYTHYLDPESAEMRSINEEAFRIHHRHPLTARTKMLMEIGSRLQTGSDNIIGTSGSMGLTSQYETVKRNYFDRSANQGLTSQYGKKSVWMTKALDFMFGKEQFNSLKGRILGMRGNGKGSAHRSNREEESLVDSLQQVEDMDVADQMTQQDWFSVMADALGVNGTEISLSMKEVEQEVAIDLWNAAGAIIETVGFNATETLPMLELEKDAPTGKTKISLTQEGQKKVKSDKAGGSEESKGAKILVEPLLSKNPEEKDMSLDFVHSKPINVMRATADTFHLNQYRSRKITAENMIEDIKTMMHEWNRFVGLKVSIARADEDGFIKPRDYTTNNNYHEGAQLDPRRFSTRDFSAKDFDLLCKHHPIEAVRDIFACDP